MKLFLIRHAEVKSRSLSANAPKQIEALKRFYEKIDLDKIYSSTLPRSKITATNFASNRNLNIIQTEDLCEVIPDSEGNLTNKEIHRLENFRKELKACKAKNIALICHGNVIRWFLSEEFDVSLKQMMKIDIYPCSTSLVAWKKSCGNIIFINNYSYIPKDIRGDCFYRVC